MSSPSQDSFAALSWSVARLVVAPRDSELGLRLDRSLDQRHLLGYRAAPRYELEQPLSPDDGWALRLRLDGQRTSEPSPRGRAVVEECERWISDNHATRGTEVIAALPAGTFLLVRTLRPIVRTERILLGNDWVPSPPNVLTLRDEGPVAAFVVGPEPDRTPSLTHLLVGFVILHSGGTKDMHEVLLFSFTGPDEEPDEEDVEPGTGGTVLLIPVDGELVLDNMAAYHEGDEQSLTRWRDELSDDLARWCANETERWPTHSPSRRRRWRPT